MKFLGQKLSKNVKGLGTKSKMTPLSLGVKTSAVPSSLQNIIVPNRQSSTSNGVQQTNLLPNTSNSTNIQYLPTGMKNRPPSSKYSLEKKKR